MKRRIQVFLAASLTLVVVLSACGPTATTPAATGTPAGTAAPSATAQPNVLIGVILSLTGPFAPIGVAERDGMNLAAQQVNAGGGIGGRKVELQILDDASTPTTAASNATRLVSDGAVAILGPNAGPQVAAASAITVRSNVLEFAGAASDIAGITVGPALFFMPPRIGLWAESMVCYISKATQAKRAAIIYSTDPAGLTGFGVLPGALTKAGIQVVDTESVDLTATDTSVQWTKIRDAKPDIIAHFVTTAAGGLTIKTARSLGVTTPIVGYIAWGQPAILKVAGPASDGAVIAGVFSGTDPAPSQAPFVKAFQDQYKRPPDMYNAMGYDMMKLAAAAIAGVPNATQKDGPALARVLESKPVEGAMVAYDFGKFDPSNPPNGPHDGVKLSSIVFLKAKDGEFVRDTQQPKCG